MQKSATLQKGEVVLAWDRDEDYPVFGLLLDVKHFVDPTQVNYSYPFKVRKIEPSGEEDFFSCIASWIKEPISIKMTGGDLRKNYPDNVFGTAKED